MKISDLENEFAVISSCRICESSNLQEILDLGLQPLANNLRSSEKEGPEKYFPLVLVRCPDCTTIQLSVNVNPKIMFQNYLWTTGTSQSSRDHCDQLSNYIIKISKSSPAILEIGSNDGTLLKALKSKTDGVFHGVDPAQNISEIFTQNGVKNHNVFFNGTFAETFLESYGKIDVVIARNVLSHVPDIIEVMRGIELILASDGLCIIEFHEASKILSEIHYDSIYHEHTFYHSIRSMSEALKKVGLFPFDVFSSPISGGSYVLVSGRDKREPSDRLAAARLFETTIGVQSEESWGNFAKAAKENLKSINEYLHQNSHRKIRAFGASARSSTLLNSIGNNSKKLSGIADNNPLKWGRYSPGQHLLIDSPKKIIQNDTEIVFICPFNFEKEIIHYLTNDLKWHGEIVLPLPNKIRTYQI
jgi:SAM-dependent methyltransferase